MQAAFVGRVEETTALEALCSMVGFGQGPAAAVIVGDPGSGKSRLLAELRLRVSSPELVVLSGYEVERQIPLGAARGLLRRLSAVPELGSPVGAIAFGAEDISAPIEPVRLFEAAHRALAALGPTIVFVDDLHWVDDVSLALLHYLVRAAETSRHPLGLVAAARSLPQAASLRGSLRALLGGKRFVEIELLPLDQQAGLRLARGLAPHLTEEQARLIWRRAGGSPFWLEILAVSNWLDADIDAVVADRLIAAGDDAAELLALLALINRPLTIEHIAHINGWSRDRASQAATAIEGHSLARRQPRGLAITHDLVREAASRTVPGDLARRLHRQLGRWLEAVAGDDDRVLLEALGHRRAGGESGASLALRLARSPRRRLLGTTGLHRLMVIGDEVGGDDPDTADLGEALALLASELGDHEHAVRLWSERSSQAGNAPDAARAALAASRAALELVRPQEAWRHLERARARMSSDPVLGVETLAQEAAVQRHLEHRPDQARATTKRAVNAARSLVELAGGVDRLDEHTRRAWLRAVLAGTDDAIMGDDPEELLALAEELAEAATGLDDRVEVKALVVGAVALRFLGRNVDAESRLWRAWDKARHRVLPQAILEVGATLGRLLLSNGKLDSAASIGAECSALGIRLTGFGPARAFMVALPWLLELTTGSDWQRAVVGLRAEGDAESDPHYRLQAHLERACALARLDPAHSGDEVRAATAAAVADADLSGCCRCQAETRIRGAEALGRIGDADGARVWLARATVPASDAHLLFFRLRADAAAMSAAGHAVEAAAALEHVIVEAQQQGLTMEDLWGRLDLGRIVSPGDRPRATAVLREAGAFAEQIGATTEVRVADQLLRALGVRTWGRKATRGTNPLVILTDPERRIAHMIASGASNPEIASTLFVSRKTVERHVSNILAKVGVRNRTELAAMVADDPQDPSIS